jgi:chemotaxis signal transduction protein
MGSQATATLRLLRCGAEGAAYGLDATGVLSIQRAERLRPAPGDGGLVGRLGDLPVHSLAHLLGGRSTTAARTQQVVVLDTGNGPWGLLVDRAAPMPAEASRTLAPLPPLVADPATDFWLGAVRVGEEVLLVLDAERLRPDAEQRPSWQPRPVPARPAFAPRRGGPRQLVLFSTTTAPPGRRSVVFGLSLAQVAEICEPLPVLTVPGAPEGVSGLVVWREHLVPVLDLAGRLGLPAAAPERRMRLLIAATPGPSALLAFPVRPGIRLLRLPAASLPSRRELPIPPDRVWGIVELEDDTVILPDLEKLE